MKRLMCLVLVVAFAHAASAQEVEEDRGPYLGISLGSFNYEKDNGEFGVFIDDSTSAYRIIGGYRFIDHFALEGSWGKTSTFKDDIAFSNGTVGMQAEYEVRTVRALGMLPLSEKISLYGALGYYDAKFDATVTNSFFGNTYNVVDSEVGTTLALGAQFDLERVDIRAEVEKFLDSGSEAWELNVGVFFRF